MQKVSQGIHGRHLDPSESVRRILCVRPQSSNKTPQIDGSSLDIATVVDRGQRSPIRPRDTIPLKPARYAHQEQIGSGGMGDVYRVRDHVLNRDVAMKVLRRDLACDMLIRRFQVEAQITGQLEHPGILPVHDLGRDAAGNSYFTMRLVPDHRTLTDIIRSLREGDVATLGEFPLSRRIQIIENVANTLRYAHQCGVIHRDIKPSNVIIGSTGEIYLADWGISAITNSGRTTLSTMKAPMEKGEWAGTPLYMSPEELLGSACSSERSDVYSLCAVAHEFFTLEHYLGSAPGRDVASVLASVADVQLRKSSYLAIQQTSRVPKALLTILATGLSVHPECALQTAAELLLALSEFSELERNPSSTKTGGLLQFWSKAREQRPTFVPALSVFTLALFTVCTLMSSMTVFTCLAYTL